MSAVRITYYGMEGAGRTLTEAKTDAGRKIEQALSGYYTPTILSWRDWAILVYRDPLASWKTAIIVDAETGVRSGRVWGGGPYATEKEAIRSAQSHLADLGWHPDDGETPPPFLTDRDLISEFRSKVQFQVRYRTARDRGLSDGDAHAYACRDPRRHDLVALVESAAGAGGEP